MVTLSTFLRGTAILAVTGLCVTATFAQQPTHRTASSQGKSVGTATRTPGPSSSPVSHSPNNTNRPALPVAASVQSPANPPAQPATVVHKTSPARPVKTAAVGSHNKYLNVGVGVAAYYGSGLPVGASFEVDLKDQLSVGGSFDYLRYSGGYTIIYAGARGSYHFAKLLDIPNKKFDPYAGATLGFRHFSYTNVYGYDYGDYNSGLFLGAHLGARYYFSDKVGGFAEVGYGISALKLGITARF